MACPGSSAAATFYCSGKTVNSNSAFLQTITYLFSPISHRQRSIFRDPSQLDKREGIHENKLDSIEDEIFRQKEHLNSAERKPGNDEVQVRHRLESLYQNKWEAEQAVWNDKQDLLEEKRSIERELRELEESKEIDEIL